MRVHTCRHCREVFPSYPDLRQHLDSHLQQPVGHICTTCKKSFTRRAYLLKHSARCAPQAYLCNVCHSSFGRKRDLARHETTIRCGGPKKPESAPKRRKIVEYLHEDTATAPAAVPLVDELSVGLQEVIRDNWASIRTHVSREPVQTRFNQRLMTTDMRVLNEPLGELFQEQTTAFKVNLGYGFKLMEKQSGRFKYYHSSCNCCGRYLEEPALITNRADFDSFLKRIHESDILQWAITQRPNSDWVCVLVTNVTFFVNRILQHPIGCVGINLPTYVKRNKADIRLEKDPHGAVYRDNLCLFRCLALHLRREAAALYAEYSDKDVHDFTGVTLDDLYRVETKFKTNLCVYKLVETLEEKTTAELVRRSLCHYPDTMYVNLYETHY